MNVDMFKNETGLDIELDMSYYDEEYGNNRYQIIGDISLLSAIAKISKFNTDHGRHIYPEISQGKFYIYL